MTLHCEIKPYIQPFERRLALLELEGLTGSSPRPATDTPHEVCFEVDTRRSATELADAVAYWERIGRNGSPTLQVLREATADVGGNGTPLADLASALPFPAGPAAPTPKRRRLRYGPHGLHEYRGKFFPQLVRALINVGRVPQGGVVVDPMCGSGTAPVEALLAGRTALALDLNPLSLLMTRTKCAILREDPAQIEAAYERVRQTLLNCTPGDLTHLVSLPSHDQGYLKRWFAESVLVDLDAIVAAVNGVQRPVIRDLFMLALSNIIRRVSWQKVEDLRVRKELRPPDEITPLTDFIKEVERSLGTMLAFLHQEQGPVAGRFDIREGDARQLRKVWPRLRGRVDAVITSPPYATALPYIDTDRLSLAYLGLLPRTEQRRRHHSMIGNRDITVRARREQWNRLQQDGRLLPKSIVTLIARIKDLNHGTEAGFRRQNLPALLAKYFFDMRGVLLEIRDMLKPGGPAYVVLGDNHTVAGGQHVDIGTSRLLAELAESIGLCLEGEVPMEMLTSRDIFKKNAIAAETILLLRKPYG